MVYLNRHVAVNLPNGIQLPNQALKLSISLFICFFFFFFFWGGGVGVRAGHVRSRRSLEHEFKRLV